MQKGGTARQGGGEPDRFMAFVGGERLSSADAARQPVDESMFVFGDPLYYLHADSFQELYYHGWSVGTWTPELWEETAEQLAAQRTSPVFISQRMWENLVSERGAPVVAVLESDYDLHAETELGFWYVAR